MPGSEWLPDSFCSLYLWLQDVLHPIEVAFLASAFAVTVALLLGAIVEVDEHVDDLMHWRGRIWKSRQCDVMNSGLTYTGDCSNETFSTFKEIHNCPNYSYTQCTRNLTQGCAETVNATFESGRRLMLHRVIKARRGDMETAGGGAPELCQDSFLPWAEVEVEDGLINNVEVLGNRTCAWRFGLIGVPHVTLPSILDWHEALRWHKFLAIGERIPCWLLAIDEQFPLPACDVVALENPITWPGSDAAWIERKSRNQRGLVIAALVVAIGGVGTVLGYRWWGGGTCALSARCFGSLNSVGNGEAEYDLPPEEKQRRNSLRTRWGMFRNNVLAEYQLIPSGPGRAGRTGGDAVAAAWFDAAAASAVTSDP